MATIKKRPRATQGEKLIERLEELDDKSQQQVIDYVFGLTVDKSKALNEEIQFDTMADMIDEINEKYRSWGKMVGLSTGNWAIDAMTMGFNEGEVTVIGGATSNGKTALAINIAKDLALKDKVVLFVTLEMTKAELGIRFKKVMGKEFEQKAANILWQLNDEMSWKSIDGLIKKAKEEAGADIVIIDHLHYFTRELQNTAEELGMITKEFKKNSIRHKIPIILISHTRKSSDSYSNKTGINDLRGSSYIAQDADVVLMVHKPNDDEIAVTLVKNRNRHGYPVGGEVIMDFKETIITAPPRYN